MDTFPDYSSCSDWQSIAALHRSTINIPVHFHPSDPALTAWSHRANASLDPPSSDARGPSLDHLLDHPDTAAILDAESLPGLHSHDATALVDLLKAGTLSVEHVTRAHLARTALVHHATNCLSHYFYHLAIQRARALDHKRRHLESTGHLDQLGSCFGLPISIKGHLHYAGQGSQRGFVYDVLPSPATHPLVTSNLTQAQIDYLQSTQGGFVNDPPVDSHLVSLLLDADVVIIGKTTMPQGVMHLDDRSNLYGQTLNPHNLALSPGGSSGGESALIAGRGVALGVGSDIGGSIRQPAGVCGLYGLRPTTLRLPYAGVRSTMPGSEGVTSSLGPMTRSLRDIELFMATVLSQKAQPWRREHSVLPMPWRRVDSLIASHPTASPKRLVVGVMLDDGVVRPSTPVRRALSSWLQKLEAASKGASAGVDIEFKMYQPGTLHRRAWDLIRSLYFMDSGKLFHLLAKATGEPLLPLTQFILQRDFVRPAEGDLAADAAGDGERRLDEMTATEVWANVRRREALRNESLQYWNKLGLDCLLCPVMGNVAPRPGKIKYWGYTSAFNLVDYPGVAFPSGFVADSEKDQEFEAQEASQQAGGWTYPPRGDDMSDFDRENRQEYEDHRAVFDGAPVGLQLIGRRFQDEELCKYVELLEHLYHRQA